MWALYKNHIKIVELLLKNGADLNIQEKIGYTALMYAAGKLNKEVVEILLKNGTDPNIQDYRGNIALVSTTVYNKQVIGTMFDIKIRYDKIIKLLLKHLHLHEKNV